MVELLKLQAVPPTAVNGKFRVIGPGDGFPRASAWFVVFAAAFGNGSRASHLRNMENVRKACQMSLILP
jgi:hypothetical protein